MLRSVLVVLLLVKGVYALCNLGHEWQNYKGSCYFVSPENDLRNYSESAKRCDELGTTLASFSNPEETNYFTQQLVDCRRNGNCDYDDKHHNYWIGLRTDSPTKNIGASANERRANWYWMDGSELSWQNWYGTEPDSGTGYARMYHNGQWADKEPHHTFRYICETSDSITSATSSTTLPNIVTTRIAGPSTSKTAATTSSTTTTTRPTTTTTRPTNTTTTTRATTTTTTARPTTTTTTTTSPATTTTTTPPTTTTTTTRSTTTTTTTRPTTTTTTTRPTTTTSTTTTTTSPTSTTTTTTRPTTTTTTTTTTRPTTTTTTRTTTRPTTTTTTPTTTTKTTTTTPATTTSTKRPTTTTTTASPTTTTSTTRPKTPSSPTRNRPITFFPVNVTISTTRKETTHIPKVSDSTTKKSPNEIAPSENPEEVSSSMNDETILYIGVGIGLGIMLFIALVLIFVICCKRKRKQDNKAKRNKSHDTSSQNVNNNLVKNNAPKDVNLFITPNTGDEPPYADIDQYNKKADLTGINRYVPAKKRPRSSKGEPTYNPDKNGNRGSGTNQSGQHYDTAKRILQTNFAFLDDSGNMYTEVDKTKKKKGKKYKRIKGRDVNGVYGDQDRIIGVAHEEEQMTVFDNDNYARHIPT